MEPITTPAELIGQHVQLLPLSRAHIPALVQAASDGELWNLRVTSVPKADTAEAYVERALEDQAQGRALAYAVLDAHGEVVGSTRCCHIDWSLPRLEIGYTWYAQRVQRTALNTEAKLLLLQQAFERFGCVAVELRTHVQNLRSQAAIERLGAKRDGILRQHMRMPDGHLRDTVVYSILDSEWPAVRANLLRRLGREVQS
jgi:RimJ/RimL family protein N-acetyltransferase